MSNNLGFEYVLNVNEQATKQNLNTFIKKTFGEGKNAKLSVPIKIDVANSLSDINFDQLQKDIDRNIKNKLKVKATVVLDTNSIKTQLTSKIGEIEKDLKFKVGLEIDPSAINLIAGTVDVMKTLNAEIDKVKNNMKELGKNLTINIGDVHLGKQYDEILETSKEIKEENKETEASLEEQLNIQKRILEEKRNQMKQTEKDIKAEEKRLNLAKERKDNNDKLIEQEKQLRKEASNLDEQIKAEQDKQKTYEKQNDALKKQSKEQKKLADDLKKTNEEIKKLENDKTSAQQRVNLAKEEEQRRANNLEMMKKENKALKEKLANLQKIANVTNEATTVDKTNKTSKGSSIKQQANDTIKQVTDVSEKRIEQEQKVTKEVEKQSEAQIKAIDKVIKAEDKASKAKENKKTTSSTSSSGKKGKTGGRRNLYEDVQSAEIAKAIHDETVQGVRSLEEEKAEMRRLGDMVANERGLLQQVTKCLERNKELTKENADEVQNLLTKLADEKTLIQEAAGNRDYANYADFKNALKKYQADPSDKNLEKLEWQMEKWGKIGAMYEYRKDVQEAINTLQKQYNIEAQRSLEIEEKQNKINEQRTSQNTQKNEAKANNWLKGKFGKYKDAGSYMEEMVGFTKDELYDALLEYEEVIDKFRLQDDDAIDYEKTERFFGRITKQINEYKEATAKATDERVINKYTEAIENLNNMITNTKKNINTWEELNRIYLADSDFDVTEDAKQKDVDLDKVISLKETVSEFAQYSKGVNLAREQTSKMRQDLSWLAKDFDKLVAEKSMEEEKWQSLADKVQQYKKELGVTEDQIKQFINTKNEEIEQGNEHLAKLKEVQKTLKRGTNEYRECSKVVKDYNNALENDLSITDIIKDMKELINILDEGKDSINNFNDDTTKTSTVKVVKQQTRDFKELFEAVASGRGTIQDTLDLLKMMLNENYKANEALKYKKDLTEDDRKELQKYAEVTSDCVKALTTMKQNMDGVAKGVQSCTKQYLQSTDKLKENYDILYKVSDKNEKVNDTEKELNNTTDKQVESTTKANQALNEQYGILIQLARGAGIAESKMSDLVMRITNAAAASRKLSKTEIGKLAKDFPSANLLGQKQARTNLVELGRKTTNGVRYNTTNDYKNQKQQIDALVDNAMDDLSEVFKQMFDEAKRLDKLTEQTNKKVTQTSKSKKQEVAQQNEIAKAVKNVTEVKQEQDSISKSLEAKQQARIREQVQLIENMSDAQQRFNAILELTGLNYDNIYKKHEKEIKTLDKAMIWKATENAAMDMGYENNIGGGDKTTYVGQYMKNKNTDMNNKKVNTDMLSEYYAKKDILGEYLTILEQYDYVNKTAEELLYDISEKGLRDSLAIETALQKTTENEKVVLEDIARIKQEIAKEGKVDLETNNKQINQLKEQLKAYEQGSGVYSKYIEDAQKQALQMVRDGKQEVTDKAVKQAMFKILGNNDTNIAYDKQIGKTDEFDKISKRLGFNKQEAQEFYDIYFKVNQLKKEISDLESKSGDSYYSRVLENLEKEKAVLEENKNYLTSLLPKQQEQAQIQQQQAEAVIETAQAIEKLAKAQDESANKTDEVAKSKDKVTEASRQAKKALDEEKEALIASANVKDHIEATMKALDKVNKSASFKKKAKEDSTLQDMFNELKREANINKSSGVLGIDYWDGLIDRIKIFTTEMIKMKAKTIDDAVNPLIYKDSGTTSTSKPLSMKDFKAQQEEKAKQRQIRQQEKNTQKLKDQQEEAKALETVLKQLEDTITNNPHTQLLKVYEDVTKITDAQERFNKILEVTGLNYDEIYQKTLKSEKAHAQKSGGIDIDKIFTEQLASFNRDDNPYNTLNYMSVANIKGFNDRVDYVAEYRAREKVLQNFINAIRTATDEEKEFIAQQELEIKTLKAYPSEAKKMLDTQNQMVEANQEISVKSKELVDNLKNTSTQIGSSNKEIKELVSITNDIDIDTLKDKFGRTWKEIAEDEAKAMKKVKEDIIMFELHNMEMDKNYSDRDDEQQKRYKPLTYMKDIDVDSVKTSKDAIPILSEYYAKIQVLTELKKQEEQATAQITQDLKESNKELDKAINKTENLAIPLENKQTKNKKQKTNKSSDSNNTKLVATNDEVNKVQDLQNITNEIVDTKQEEKQITQKITNEVEKQTNLIEEQKQAEGTKLVVDEKSKQVKQNVTNEIEKQTQAEEKSLKVKQNKVEVENEEVKALKEQIAKNEELIKQEEEAMQDAKETATMHEMEVATINYKIKQAKELRDEQEKQLANANENNEKMKEEYILQDEGIKRITEKIKALEEEKRLKEQMADDLKQQLIQEEALGDVSDDVLNSMIDDYNRLRKEAEDTKKSIDLITTAIKNQKDYEEMSRTGVNPLQPINNSPQSAPNWTTGGSDGSNGGGNNNDGSIREGNAYNEILSERIKLKQRALMLDIENLVYGKDLTDSQKLMVNELVEQVVQLGRSVTSMKELSFEAQKIKQNINETKFDVKVSTTEDKNAKKLLEQKRKETTEMYKGLFDQAIAQEEAKLNAEREKRNELTRMYTRLMDEAIAKEDARAKYIKEQTVMYTKLWEQYEKGVQAEERAKVVLEDKIAKQKDLWQLKVKEFSQSDNSNYADPKDIANMKQMADNIGNNVTNMRELNQQLHEMNMVYKEISSNSKNTKAMFNDAEKTKEEAEANKQAQQALKELIATKEEDLRQTHQSIQNNKVYRNATESQRMAFDALRKELKLTGETTEEVNAQYKKLTQQMNGMKLDMVTSQLNQHESIFKKVINTMKQYVTMNFDVMDMFNYLQRGFQNAFEHIKALDEAYTNISMTMSITNEQFKTMTDTAMEVGNANGQLQTEVLEMMKVYANAGTTVEEINKQMKATVAFQNVSDLDASSVTQSIQTIIQQYKLLDSGAMDAAEATEYLGDVMVAVAYNLAKEESVAMQEVISGIETAGNMIKTSGGSFEWFTSVIGTLSEVMNASGSETANAINIFVA